MTIDFFTSSAYVIVSHPSSVRPRSTTRRKHPDVIAPVSITPADDNPSIETANKDTYFFKFPRPHSRTEDPLGDIPAARANPPNLCIPIKRKKWRMQSMKYSYSYGTNPVCRYKTTKN